MLSNLPSSGDTCHESPAYRVRHSARARRISLRILHAGILEVVLPAGTPESIVPQVLSSMGPWLRKHGDKLCPQADSLPVRLPFALPLYGGEQTLPVTAASAPGNAAVAPGSKTLPPLCIPGRYLEPAHHGAGDEGVPLTDRAAAWLRAALRTLAARELSPLACELAARHGFAYTDISFRLQKSRWGSCSVHKKISLNACLLFLPLPLARHVILHELCHTVVFNHSHEFWRRLQQSDPDARRHNKALATAWQYVPRWMLAS